MEKVKSQINWQNKKEIMVMKYQLNKSYQKNVLWNMIFSMINAGQSMLLLIIVNRLAGEDAAGLFSFAFSVAVLMMYIGNYGIRNFQVSDVKEHYSFGDYCGFRVISCLSMGIISFFYIIAKGYAGEKAILILLLCVMRLAECLEDVFHGRYQQLQRLDLACKQGTIRICSSIIVFFLALLLGKKLIFAVLLYSMTNLLSFLCMTVFTVGQFGGFQLRFSLPSMKSLLIECFPLFCGYFFSTYLGNVSKYAIDDYGTYQMQAHFNMIFMPVLVINLVSTMIFRPIIVDMAALWNEGKKEAFYKLVFRQLKWILVISLFCIPLCLLAGLPILSLLYGTHLEQLKFSFFILLTGGCFSAASSFLNVCIITIREQKKLLYVIGLISLLALITGDIFVKNWGMTGASCLYLLLCTLQAMAYFTIAMRKKSGKAG